jgi:hypothetical protein
VKTVLLSRQLAEECAWSEAFDSASPLALSYPTHEFRASKTLLRQAPRILTRATCAGLSGLGDELRYFFRAYEFADPSYCYDGDQM